MLLIFYTTAEMSRLTMHVNLIWLDDTLTMMIPIGYRIDCVDFDWRRACIPGRAILFPR